MSLELWGLLVIERMFDTQVLTAHEMSNQILHFFGRNHRWVNKEELKVDGRGSVLMQEEITVAFKKL